VSAINDALIEVADTSFKVGWDSAMRYMAVETTDTDNEARDSLASVQVRGARARLEEMDKLDDGLDVPRPDSVPKEGMVEAFDAGWNAHRRGLERTTVQVMTPVSGLKWALLGYDCRETVTKVRDVG
jgi:hypothetical protein